MTIPLEDRFSDIVAKAQMGLGLTDHQLAEKVCASEIDVLQFKAGDANASMLETMALALELNPVALAQIANGSFHPATNPPLGLYAFNTPFDDYSVNSYLIFE